MDLDAYFARIGYGRPVAPDLATLTAIVGRQAASIPFGAIDVLLDKGIDIAPAAVFEKLVLRKRDGYCFEQNSLLLRVLTALGFDATPRLARVLWMRPADARPARATHMVLIVRVGGRDYLADAGFGNGTPTAPLAFDTLEPQPTSLETFRLRSDLGGHLLEMQIDDGWTPVYEILPGVPRAGELADANHFTSTHPDSRFRHDLMLALATADARHLLVGNRLTIRPVRGAAKIRFLESPADLEDAVAAVFGLTVEAEWRPLFEAAIRRQKDQPR